MMRLGAALGARPETFMGLSGLGDLVLTATSEHSRNLAFGMALGARPPAGGAARRGRCRWSRARIRPRIAADARPRHGVDTPIIAAVAAIVDGSLGVDAAIEGLVSRPLKRETE